MEPYRTVVVDSRASDDTKDAASLGSGILQSHESEDADSLAAPVAIRL